MGALAAPYVALRHALHPVAVRARRWRRPFVLHALGRTAPLSPHFGVERGTPLDRPYIDHFVSAHAGDIKGRALEFQSDRYLADHGSAVHAYDIVDRFGTESATIVTDRATDTLIPTASYDCAIVTQVLHYVYDVHAAVEPAPGAQAGRCPARHRPRREPHHGRRRTGCGAAVRR